MTGFQRIALCTPGLAILLTGCGIATEKPLRNGNAATAAFEQSPLDSVAATNADAPAHNVRVYVSAVNCEMNAEDAQRLNAVARTSRMPLEVVFTGIQDNNRAILEQATRDLGLEVPTRVARAGELEQYKSIGGAYLQWHWSQGRDYSKPSSGAKACHAP